MLREEDFEKAEREIERLTKENQQLVQHNRMMAQRIENLEKEVLYLDAMLQGRRPGLTQA